MTSRLYRTTRPLATQVALMVDRLGVRAVVGSPTTVALIALYVSGLVLLDGRQRQTRVALFLPSRAHDALNRLLRVMPLSTRTLMGLLIAFCKRRHHGDGYLCLDEMWSSRRRSPRSSLGRDGPTPSPRSARSTGCTWWCCCGAAPMGGCASPWLFACGGPNARVRHTSTGPSSGWQRPCSRRSSVRGCAPNTSSSTPITVAGG